ncbi:hypothetical protein ACRQ8J_000252 [Escherichia coli]
MAVKASGRFVPPSAFAAGTGKMFTGAYAWNAPREAVGRERPLIRVDLAQNGIRPQRWELEALARGATVNYDGKKFTYPVADEWPGFSTVMARI